MKKATIAIASLLCTAALLCSCSSQGEDSTSRYGQQEQQEPQGTVESNTPEEASVDFDTIAEQAVMKYPTFNDDWKYSVFEDITGVYDTFIALVQYTGSETVVEVPSEIEGAPVICLTTAFAYNTAVQKVVLPDTVIDIGKGAFQNCQSLQEVVLPSSVKKIRDEAFLCCYALQKMVIPDSVIEIGSYAFSNCTALQQVELPDSLTKIGSYAFSNCDSLQSAKIPSRITSLEQAVFYMCKSLSDVQLPATLTSIGEYVFWGCAELKQIFIPLSVSEIAYNSFGDYGEGPVIYGYPESEAARFCAKHGISFKVMSE